MTNEIRTALADLKALQQAGQHMACPRCGRDTKKPGLVTNALSRHVDGVFVCDQCGTAEAMLDFMNNPLPIECWAFLRDDVPAFDFHDLPGKVVWEKIRFDHGPVLIDLFRRWIQAKPGADFRAYRNEAFRRCPGLTEIWSEPFQAKYDVLDGELILRLRCSNDGIEIAADLLENDK
ncbi:MAG: hypothetical protein IJ174_05375 [Clostridia bacterium]|nr:hypothetical protein [Clostridia bacterium]